MPPAERASVLLPKALGALWTSGALVSGDPAPLAGSGSAEVSAEGAVSLSEADPRSEPASWAASLALARPADTPATWEQPWAPRANATRVAAAVLGTAGGLHPNERVSTGVAAAHLRKDEPVSAVLRVLERVGLENNLAYLLERGSRGSALRAACRAGRPSRVRAILGAVRRGLCAEVHRQALELREAMVEHGDATSAAVPALSDSDCQRVAMAQGCGVEGAVAANDSFAGELRMCAIAAATAGYTGVLRALAEEG